MTGLYTVIAGLTLIAIKRQADLMEKQAEDATQSSADAKSLSQRTLEALQRQADLMVVQNIELAKSVRIARITAVAARKSADAAQRSAEAFIDRERPHVTVLPTFFYATHLAKGRSGTISLFVANVGSSNAKNATCEIYPDRSLARKCGYMGDRFQLPHTHQVDSQEGGFVEG